MVLSFKSYLLKEEVDNFTKRFFASFNYQRDPNKAIYDRIDQLTPDALKNFYQSSFFTNLDPDRQSYVKNALEKNKSITFGTIISALRPMLGESPKNPQA
jgi:hypothetical protein